MKTSLALFLVLASFLVSNCADLGKWDNNCAFIDTGYSIFNVCPYAISKPFDATTTGGTATFSIGAPRTVPCSKTGESWAVFNDALKQCIDIATAEPSYTQLSEENPDLGLQITYPTVTRGTTVKESSQLIVKLNCDKTITEVAKSNFKLTTSLPVNGVTVFTVTGSNLSGCPVVTYGAWVKFFREHEKIFAAILAVIGLFLTFFGLKLFKVAVFTITSLAGAAIASSIFFNFIPVGSPEWVLWAVFLVSAAVGAILGHLALRYEKFSYFVLGAALGVVGAFVLYNAVLSPMLGANAGTTPLYITIGIGAILGGFLGLKLLHSIVVISTSVIGAYVFTKAISVFAGGFPSESDVAKGVQSFTPVTYAYLIGMAVLALIGIIYQFRELGKQGGDSKGGKHYQQDLEH